MSKIFLGELSPYGANIYRVGFVHYMPLDAVNGLGKTEAELNTIGLLVDTMPDAAPPEGKVVGAMLVHKPSKAISYEYIDRPVTEEEKTEQRLTDLENRLAEKDAIIDALLIDVLMGGDADV